VLLEKTWKIDDVCTIKMSTGEEVIAKITASNDSSITISKPLVLQVGVDPSTNQPVLQMLPSFLFSAQRDAKLNINLNHVITIAPSEENAKNSYISSTTNLAVLGKPSNLIR